MTNNNGFTLVELTIVMLLGSIFIFGLTQYWITSWRMIDREKSVLALCAEARAIQNILLNGGTNVTGLRESGPTNPYTRNANPPLPFFAGFDTIDYMNNSVRFQVGEDADDGTGNNRHVFQYCPGACNYDAEFRTLYSRYVDGAGLRHGYLRGMTVTVGGAPENVTIDMELDDFQARVITFDDPSPADNSIDTEVDYFKQTFRFFAYAHAQ